MKFKDLPNFSISTQDPIATAFLNLGITKFHSAVQHIWQLPYGRNSDRTNYELVISENCGTCSTKHALLAKLAQDHEQSGIKLMLGIYLMSEKNTPGVGPVLENHNLDAIPEAHSYLLYGDQRYDFTMPDSSSFDPNMEFLLEESIESHRFGAYKVEFHQRYIRDWMQGESPAAKFSFEELLSIREECIAKLSQIN